MSMPENTGAPPSGQEVQPQGQPATDIKAEPSVVELKEDMLVKLPGSDKPTKYGDWFRGFQGRYTEATQARSALQREVQAQRERLEALQQEAQRYRAALDLKPPQENPANKLREQLKGLPYLKGEEAAQLAEALYGEVEGTSKKLQVRDQAIRLLAQELVQMKEMLGGLTSRAAETDFQSKIERYRAQLGLPEESRDFLSELYSAYTGDQWDEEFPEVARQRWEQLQGLFTTLQKKRVEDARRARFIPGKGGQVTPGKGGPIDTSQMSAKEAADALFETFVRPGEDS